MAFQYTPLDDPETDIRLILLQPGAYDDDLRILFKQRPLEVNATINQYRT